MSEGQGPIDIDSGPFLLEPEKDLPVPFHTDYEPNSFFASYSAWANLPIQVSCAATRDFPIPSGV